MTAFLIQKWEDIDNAPLAASTEVASGDFLKYDGSGHVVPATPGTAIVGLCLNTIQSTDPDYASVKQISYQKAGSIGQYRFIIPVTTGTATAAMIGLKFDLDDAGSLDVSGSGTQFTITNFISATLVEVTVILPA